MPRPQAITETITLSEAAVAEASRTGRLLVEMITPGWGSSGYYSPDVIEQAAVDRVIPAGTHMYADHPTAAEDMERPIRSIRDLVAVTSEDARLSESGSLVAQAQVVPTWQPFIETVHEAIGVSIRGSATDIVPGEAEGRTGPIIEGLVAPVLSVDFVTRAGRGGRVLQLLESAAASSRAVGHGVSEATVNDIRDALNTALRDTYGGEKTYVWVRDFDETTVWFELEGDGDAGIFAQDYDTDGAALTGDRREVRVVTTYQPVGEHAAPQTSRSTRPGSTTTTEESEEDTMPITIEESELTRLREDAGRVPTLITERDTAIAERDQARAENRSRSNVDAARGIIAEQRGVSFSELEIRGLTANLPVTEAGELDTDTFRAAVEAEVAAAREAHAQTLEEAGVGSVRGMGHIVESGKDKTPTQLREESDQVRGQMFGRGSSVKEA